MTTQSTAKTASKYTPAQEAVLRDSQPLDQAKSEALAARFNAETNSTKYTGKSVAAKANRMGLTYIRKVAVSKTGSKIEQKDEIVSEIGRIVGLNVEGLDKAPKLALQNLRNFLLTLDEDEAEAA
jgi:hypothetical protein